MLFWKSNLYKKENNLTPFMINENQGCKMVYFIKIIQKMFAYYEGKLWHLNSKYYYVNIFWMILMSWNFLFVARCSLVFARSPFFFLFVARCSLFFGRWSWLFCSLFVTFYLLLDKKFWRIFLRKVNKKVLHINLHTKKLICDELENWDILKLETLSNLYGY